MLAVFLDSETTGLNPKKHKIVEIAYQIVDVETGEVKEEYQTIISQPFEIWKASDPESLHVNGFKWEEIEKGEKPDRVAEHITNSFQKNGIKRNHAVFICQNPSFDRVFFSQLIDTDIQESLKWPYHWLDLASMYWATSMEKGRADARKFPWVTGISKDKIAAVYQLGSEGMPHRAMNGVKHLVACYSAVVGFTGK